MKRIAFILFTVLIVGIMGCSEEPAGKAVQVSEPVTTVVEEMSEREPSVTEPGVHEVVVQGKAFRPFMLEVNSGDTIVFRKVDSKNHTIVFYENEEYTGRILTEDDTYEITFDEEPGVYKYKDTESGGTGLIEVV